MDVYKIKIYPTAKKDLQEIIDYLNTLSQQAALRYYDLLIEEIESLSQMPFARWDGSCDLSDKPTCKMPKPSRIKPTARIREKIKSLRLLTTANGSPSAANAGTTKNASMKNTLAKIE